MRSALEHIESIDDSGYGLDFKAGSFRENFPLETFQVKRCPGETKIVGFSMVVE